MKNPSNLHNKTEQESLRDELMEFADMAHGLIGNKTIQELKKEAFFSRKFRNTEDSPFKCDKI